MQEDASLEVFSLLQDTRFWKSAARAVADSSQPLTPQAMHVMKPSSQQYQGGFASKGGKQNAGPLQKGQSHFFANFRWWSACWTPSARVACAPSGSSRPSSGSSHGAYGCGCQNRSGIPFWLAGEFTTHFRLPILVVGLGCSLAVRFRF